ncbi:hypothetical protein GOY17_02405 [Lysobacter soli]|uniref:hypothetical protein n=1 Tax=Lysobacter soli TaxID=453783 RepID=UPI0012EEAB22|nr:hypothetical protein [Lysobacter soli]QGW63869.1 hypothetical protein GOY17_02405 [Lysobacter soli]
MSAFDPKRTSALRIAMHVTKAASRLYAVAIGLAIAWAWYADVTMLRSGVEHLTPELLLLFLSMPSSLTLPVAVERSPEFLAASAHGQLVWLTICGAMQALAIILLEALVWRRSRSAMSASGR